MRQVVNCVIQNGDRLLLLQKPRRGWWVAPGGKVERGESLVEAVTREVFEETGLVIEKPNLRGVFTIVLQENEQLTDHWMLYTFHIQTDSEMVKTENEEGVLAWVPVADLASRPMAEGDRHFFQGILNGTSIMTGKFTYTPDYSLLDWKNECE